MRRSEWKTGGREVRWIDYKVDYPSPVPLTLLAPCSSSSSLLELPLQPFSVSDGHTPLVLTL